jgi:hypothetical protein
VVAHTETLLVSDHPVRSNWRLRGIFLMSRPPLSRNWTLCGRLHK